MFPSRQNDSIEERVGNIDSETDTNELKDRAEVLTGPIDGGDSGERSVEFNRASDG